MQSVKLIYVVPIDRRKTRTLLHGRAFSHCFSLFIFSGRFFAILARRNVRDAPVSAEMLIDDDKRRRWRRASHLSDRCKQLSFSEKTFSGIILCLDR